MNSRRNLSAQSGTSMLALLACFAGSNVAALTAADDVFDFQSMGVCEVIRFADSAFEDAEVLVSGPPISPLVGVVAPNSTIWFGGTVDTEGDLSPADIAGCLGIAETDIATFAEDGADGPSYAADPYVGFEFTLGAGVVTNDLNFVGGGSYEFSIGTRPVPADTSGPMPSISNGPVEISDLDSFTVQVSFDENINDFGDTLDDVVATNGTVTSITGSGAGPYTITITPSGDGDVAVTVPAGAGTDDAGNGNAATTVAYVVVSSIAETTTEEVVNATLSRARATLANQPNLAPLLADRDAWYLDANATNDGGFLRFFKGPLWFNLDYSTSSVGDLDSSTVFGVIGSHQYRSDNLIIGSMLQFDITDSDQADFSQSSNGILAGPYFVASNQAQTLFYDGSLLLGVTQNEISPLGTYSDDYLSKRWLATFKVSGNIERDAYTLRPDIDLKYISDENDGYTDDLGNDISASGVNIAEAAVGFDAIVPVNIESGSLKLLVGAHGIYASEEFTGAAQAIRDDSSDGRGRIDLGFEWIGEGNGVFTAQVFADGLGNDDYAGQGLSVRYEITF